MSTTPRNNRRRKTSLLSKARWAGYAAAGAATALGTYEAAEAGIHHFDIDPDKLVQRNKFAIDLPGGSTSDLVMSHHVKKIFDVGGTFLSSVGYAYANPWGVQRLAKIRGFASGTLYFADNFANKQDKLINAPTSNFFDFGTMAGAPDSRFGFGDAGQGYIGFSFDAGNGTQYGWLQVNMKGSAGQNSYDVIDYAYADPGEEINAGQTQAVPEPGSLGLLAVGGVGLLLWRRKRRQDMTSY